jgi:hypothetical protein
MQQRTKRQTTAKLPNAHAEEGAVEATATQFEWKLTRPGCGNKPNSVAAMYTANDVCEKANR